MGCCSDETRSQCVAQEAAEPSPTLARQNLPLSLPVLNAKCRMRLFGTQSGWANFGGGFDRRRILECRLIGPDCWPPLGSATPPSSSNSWRRRSSACGSRIKPCFVLCRLAVLVQNLSHSMCACNRRSRRRHARAGAGTHACTDQQHTLHTCGCRSRVVGDAGHVSSDPQRRERQLVGGPRRAARRHPVSNRLGTIEAAAGQKTASQGGHHAIIRRMGHCVMHKQNENRPYKLCQ